MRQFMLYLLDSVGSKVTLIPETGWVSIESSSWFFSSIVGGDVV